MTLRIGWYRVRWHWKSAVVEGFHCGGNRWYLPGCPVPWTPQVIVGRLR